MTTLIEERLPYAFDRLRPEQARNICHHVLRKYKEDFDKIQSSLSNEGLIEGDEEEEDLGSYELEDEDGEHTLTIRTTKF